MSHDGCGEVDGDRDAQNGSTICPLVGVGSFALSGLGLHLLGSGRVVARQFVPSAYADLGCSNPGLPGTAVPGFHMSPLRGWNESCPFTSDKRFRNKLLRPELHSFAALRLDRCRTAL